MIGCRFTDALCHRLSRSVGTRRGLVRLVPTLMALAPLPSAARAQGVQYTVMPSATYLRWDSRLGLERALLFGGRAVADFGPLVSLEGDYLISGGVVARFSETGLTDSLGNALENGTVDITTYGLRVRMNLGNARIAPFLRAGGSVMRFDDGARTGPRQIAVAYGAGLRYSASPRLRAELFAEDLRFRLDRSSIAQGATPGTDPEAGELRSNLAFGASLGFVLGGGADERDSGERWSFASLPLEAFAGRLDFAEGSLAAQPVVGVRAGIDAGNYVGLRAYYLRGVSSGYRELEGVRSVGGEAQFNLNALPRLAPYLVVGGGTLGFAPGYLDSDGNAPADRTVLVLGGGMGLRLTDKLRLNIAARDFLHGRQARLGDVSDVGDVQHNWLYAAGISFSVGRSRKGIALVSNEAVTAAAADSASRLAAADTLALPDSIVRADSVMSPAALTTEAGDSGMVRRGDRSYHSATTVTLPIPTEGELYIRYGPPASRDSIGGRRLAVARDSAVAEGAERVAARPAGAARPAVAAPASVAMQGAQSDTAALRVALRRMFEERRQADSLLVSDLVAAEVARWRAEEARRQAGAGGSAAAPAPAATPAPSTASASARSDSLFALLRADRDAARAEQRQLQRRLDSLEASLRGEAAARNEAQAAERRAREDAQREADERAAAAEREEDQRAAAAAQREAEERTEASRRDAEQRDAATREAELLGQRRDDALTLVERSIPSVIGVSDTERGLVIALGNDLFATGRATLGERARAELRAVATVLALYPDAAVVVEGHTDDVGEEAANQRLSEARAEAVRSALVAYGTASSRITARGYGESRPLASNATADGRARNRRAEVVILGAQRPRPGPER